MMVQGHMERILLIGVTERQTRFSSRRAAQIAGIKACTMKQDSHFKEKKMLDVALL